MEGNERARLIVIYRKTDGGHTQLSDEEYVEYAALRKKEYQDMKTELLTNPNTATVRAVKDDAGDIVGWVVGLVS